MECVNFSTEKIKHPVYQGQSKVVVWKNINFRSKFA
jgi:hypothetical protein